MILNTTEPTTVIIAGSMDLPRPLSAAAVISYVPVIASRSMTCFILISAYFITSVSVV